jgi:hypothetical protein
MPVLGCALMVASGTGIRGAGFAEDCALPQSGVIPLQ